MATYGDFTRGIPCNVYAVAHDSHLDFGTYFQIMSEEIPCISVYRTDDLGLKNVEGAILTGERHILVDQLRSYFEHRLGAAVHFNMSAGDPSDDRWDATIDATFCANDSVNIDRYEVCLTVLLRGSVERAVTVMDGPFPSLYPWDEARGICSLTSAKFTPLHITRSNYGVALDYKNNISRDHVAEQCRKMIVQMSFYYPAVQEFELFDARIAIRAMPRSNSDSRLIDVRISDRILRIRAGKLDAVFAAERVIEQNLDLIRSRNEFFQNK
jgi:hypothetical protein